MCNELIGHRALVTGGTAGIGLACTRLLIQAGAVWSSPAETAGVGNPLRHNSERRSFGLLIWPTLTR